MKHLTWIAAGLLMFSNVGCCKLFGLFCPPAINFDVEIVNGCPGNALQEDVAYQINYMGITGPGQSEVKLANGHVDKNKTIYVEIEDGADLDGDGFLDDGELTTGLEGLHMFFDYLDSDVDANGESGGFRNLIRDGATVRVTFQDNCQFNVEVFNPTSQGTESIGNSKLKNVQQSVRKIMSGGCCQ